MFETREELLTVAAGGSSNSSVYTFTNKGQIVKYFFSIVTPSLDNISVDLYVDGIKRKTMLIADQMTDIFLDVQSSAKVFIKVTNSEASQIQIVVYFLVQQF